MKNYEYEEWLDEKYLSPDYPTDEEMEKTELTIEEIKKEISTISSSYGRLFGLLISSQ